MKIKFKRIIKNILIPLGYYSGFFGLNRLQCRRNDLVPIVVYHRIVDDAEKGRVDSSFKLRGLSVSKTQFEKQIGYLKKNYKVISLAEYIKLKNHKQRLSGYAVVTFDDGFKDFLVLGWEVLKKYQMPVTVFIFKEALEKAYWQHRIYFILDAAKRDFIAFNFGIEGTITVNLKSNGKKYQTIIKLITFLKDKPAFERGQIIDELAKELGISKEPEVKETYLIYDDITRLSREGVSFGAHSVRHDNLSGLTPSQLKEEVSVSLDYVSNITNQKDIPFALPFGASSENVIAELKIQGCLCNFISSGGLNFPEDDNFKLKRVAALEFPLSEFVYNVSGAEMFFSRFYRVGKQK